MSNKETLDKFYADVEALDLKFPVAAIADRTGFSKGNVSVYLSKKKEPSQSFLNKFYKEFSESSTKVPRGTETKESSLSSEEIRSLIQTLADVSASNKILAESTRELVFTNQYLSGASSAGTGVASEVSEGKSIVRHDPVEYIPGFLDKPEIHYNPKKKEKKKDISP